MTRLFFVLTFICRLSFAQENSTLRHLEPALASHDANAVKSIQQALISSNSESAETLIRAGALLAENGLLLEAGMLFDRCTERFPNLFEAKYNSALARIGLGDYPGAERVIDKIAPASATEKTAVSYLRGKIYLETGDFAKSKRFLEMAYKADPASENYALDYASSLIRSGDYLPAIEVLEPASRKHSDSPDITVELALANALAGRLPQTLALCRTLTDQGDPAAAHLFAAFAQCRASDFDGCRKEALAGLAAPDAKPYLHYLLAEALWNESKQSNRALSELDIAIAAMPGCSACLLLRSKVFEANQNNSQAISDLKTLTRLDPTFGPAWARLAALYRKNGDSEASALATQKYQSLHDNEISQEVSSFREQFLRSQQTQ